MNFTPSPIPGKVGGRGRGGGSNGTCRIHGREEKVGEKWMAL